MIEFCGKCGLVSIMALIINGNNVCNKCASEMRKVDFKMFTCQKCNKEFEDLYLVVEHEKLCHFLKKDDPNLVAGTIGKSEDLINEPNHYHKGGVDVIAFCNGKVNDEQMKGFYRVNVIKYVGRYELKNGLQDLEKAKWNLEKLIELEGK